MIDETLQKIKTKVENSQNIKEHNKKEYLDLIKTLNSEINELSKTKADHAESITGFAQLSAHEVTRDDTNQNLKDISIQGFSNSVEGFEASHPRLVEVVNTICTAFSKL